MPVSQNVAWDAVAFAPMAGDEKPDDRVGQIENELTTKCLAIKDHSLNEFAPAVQRACSTTFVDDWTFRWERKNAEGIDVWRIINRNSGQCLAMDRSRINEIYGQIVQVECSRGATYEIYWSYMPGTSAVTFPLKPISSELAAAVYHDSRDNDATVVLGSEVEESWIWNVSFID